MKNDTALQVLPAVLLAVREATHHSHKALERLTPFFRPEFDRPAYLRWLDLMHSFYRRIDAAIAKSAFSDSTGWCYAPRSGLLAGDIAALENRSPNETSDSDGILASLSGLTQVGEIAGMLYVVEGSALGGQVLMKVLQRSAGVTPELGASFFLPHGESPQLRWAEYVQLLACLPTTSASEQETVQGAVTTFNALHDWVERKWRG